MQSINLHQSASLTNRNLYHFTQVYMCSMWRMHKWWCAMWNVTTNLLKKKVWQEWEGRVKAGFKWSVFFMWHPAPGCRHPSAAEGHSFPSHDDVWRPKLYYSAKFEDICVYCAASAPPWSDTELHYPQCRSCLDKPPIPNAKKNPRLKTCVDSVLCNVMRFIHI